MDTLINIQPLLNETEFTCFIVPGLFSKEDCDTLLSPEMKSSFQKAISNYPTYYRNNDRLVLDDEALAARLFRKVKPYLPENIRISSAIESENGSWNLKELNTRLRFCRYSANQYFHRHLDGIHYRSAAIQSKLTFMIYLNDSADFEGGKTLFYKSKDATEIWASYIPKQGDLIVFDHNVWHEGEMLLGGEKFVLRSDILYEREGQKELASGGHLGYIWKLIRFDENTLLSGGRDKCIHVWNSEMEILQSLEGHNNSILCIEKISDSVFISGSRDKKIKVWERDGGGKFAFKKDIEIHSALVLSLCRISDDVFASGGGDNLIRICSLEGDVIQTLAEHSNWVKQVIVLSENHLASCSEDGTIKIWNTAEKNSLATFREEKPVFCMAWVPAKKQLISGNLDGEITIRELSADYKELTKTTFKAHSGIIRTLIVISDDLIASGGEDNKVKILKLSTGECVKELLHQNFVQSIIVSNGKLLSASYDGTIKSWELPE